ncbi:MAG: hypothetical protein WAM53_11005, partial [Terrimicrobiaceae bacterium]
ALEYDEWQVSFIDLVVIFGLGLLQYELIGKLEASTFRPTAFETWIAVITGVALAGHLRAHWKVQREPGRSAHDVGRETRLQRTNLAVAATCFILALLVIAVDASAVLFTAVVSIQAALITLNIYRSVHVTIYKPMQLAREELLDTKEAQPL